MGSSFVTQSIYYIDSYVPSYLASDNAYGQALRDRIQALMEMQEWSVIEINGPRILQTPDCPPPPGMVTVRVGALVSEFDTEIVMGGDEQTECRHLETWFDRTICGLCNGMHTICVECGDLLSDCGPQLDRTQPNAFKWAREQVEQEKPLPRPAPLQREAWERFDGEGEYVECDSCGQTCVAPIKARADQRIICDDCMGKS